MIFRKQKSYIKSNMKRDRKSVDERRMKVLDMVREQKEVSVEQLAEIFQVSLMTVRRDLHYLEERGLLDRFYGGATVQKRWPDAPEEDIQLCREKIAQYAARFVEEGDRLFINGSMTALNMLKYVGEKKVSVFTNNANVLSGTFPPGVTLCLTGGEIRGHIMVGDYVMRNLLTTHAEKTFIGCAAVYDNGEFRYDIPTEIGINESMIARTKGELYILVDHSKIQSRSSQVNQGNMYGSCTYDHSLTLITDEFADADCVERLRQNGIKVIQIKID